MMKLEFEGEIQALENKVLDHPSQDNLIAFYGSSSIRLWETLEEDLSPLNVINLGFGGSSFSWCIYYFDRVFTRIKPSRVIIYVGDNDLAAGIPPEKVLKKFRMLTKMVRMNYPNIPMDFISIKPSPIRTHLLPEIQLTNQLIRKELLAMGKASLIDVHNSMLNENGVARPELYVEDQLHLNADGYRIWKGVVRKHLGI